MPSCNFGHLPRFTRVCILLAASLWCASCATEPSPDTPTTWLLDGGADVWSGAFDAAHADGGSHPDASAGSAPQLDGDAAGNDAAGNDAAGNDAAGNNDATGNDAAGNDAGTPPEIPAFPHLDAVIDAVRGAVPTWATFIHAVSVAGTWQFTEVGYNNAGHDFDFWPASVIKIYPSIAALIIIKQLNVTLDAKATFYRRAGKGAWIKDTTRSVRDMIHGAFNCSSNSDYTLLLRLAGLDWINTKLLVPAHGFSESVLMVGYVTARPYAYVRTEEQRIVLVDGAKSHERLHKWGGVMHSKKIGCKVVYSSVGAANCSSTHDMAEHVRRIAWHDELAAQDKFDVRVADLNWLRYGGKTLQMSNKSCSALWAGVKKVFPNADYMHKGGKISTYALGVHYVADKVSGVRYVLGIATKSATKIAVIALSEAVARMAQNPWAYLHLNNLKDNVNPVKAKMMVYSAQPAVVDLVTKDAKLSAADPTGWQVLPGSEVNVGVGTKWHDFTSKCLGKSGKVHIKGRLRVGGEKPVFSDLHYVVVSATAPCP
jgi:hypothetical protein